MFLCNIKENTVIEASRIYTFLADDMTEAAFYKTLERFCQSGSLVHLTKGLYYKPKKSRFGIVPIREQDIVTHYIGNQKGLVVRLRNLYNEKGLTTRAEVSRRKFFQIMCQGKENNSECGCKGSL